MFGGFPQASQIRRVGTRVGQTTRWRRARNWSEVHRLLQEMDQIFSTQCGMIGRRNLEKQSVGENEIVRGGPKELEGFDVRERHEKPGR